MIGYLGHKNIEMTTHFFWEMHVLNQSTTNPINNMKR